MDELTREFLIESQEGLDRMERCLTDLEARPGDTALLSEIFRAVHTIKGTTGFLGFKRLEKVAHAGENLLGLLRDGKLSASTPVVTALLQLLDGLRGILKTIEADGNEGHGDDEALDRALIARLDELRAPAEQGAEQPAAAVAPRPVVEKPRRAAPRVQRSATPKTAKQSTSSAPCSSPVVTASVAPAEPAPAGAALYPAAIPAEPLPLELAPQPAPRSSQPPASPALDRSPESPHDGVPEPSADASKPRTPASGTAAESTLRVDVALLNRMMNLVGELVLTRNQVLQATAADPNMTLLSRRLDMVTADLRESVMKARMQPVSNIFSKMPRIVRDLSQSLHRRVSLQMEGQETELDKSLLEAIKDPLTHAVRNALDHGIEPPEVRQAAGKDPEGRLTLRAVQEGSHVLVEVADDGAGIDAAKIREKAVERGLIAPERAAGLAERELLQLIFLPGFSTAEKVTNVSGRGVGMDVVRTNVEKIGGKVEIDSRAGKGTTLRLRIPLTLAIVPALIVRSLNQSFALPQAALSELVHIPPEQAASAIDWIENAPLYRLRGRLLPLVFLDGLLMPGRDCKLAVNRDNFIAVLDADGRRFGLVVDSLADPEEIVVKPLSAILKDIGIYSGATVLGSGDLALILDPGTIALKTGVTMNSDETQANVADDASARLDYLLVDVAGRRAAVPLGDVLRIEQVPLSRIEYVGARPILNFEGQLLPIEDSGGVLSANSGDPNAPVIVVVCRDGERHVGIAVSHVLDVAGGANLVEAGTGIETDGVTLLKDRVTDIVDLIGVQSLPAARKHVEEWKPEAEALV